MALQGSHQGLRQQGETVLGALPIAHNHCCAAKSNLHPSWPAFPEAEPRPIQQACHEPGRTIELRQDCHDFLSASTREAAPARSFRVRDGATRWPGVMQDRAVQEQERVQGHILG